MLDLYRTKADQDFDRARTREFLSRLGHFLSPERESLMSLQEIKTILKPKGQTYRGMQVVAIRDILGSEGRYRDFNRRFLPRHEFLRQRWVKIDTAHYRDVILPPIQLYEIGGAYFVRDGNHRVSVARLQGIEAIDAEVTSLDTEIMIEAGLTAQNLKERLLRYEKRLFEESTSYPEAAGGEAPEFSEPGRYDVLLNHILGHKYYINQDQTEEIPLPLAIQSWQRHVYLPIIAILKEERVIQRFPGRTEADLYVWVVGHWHELKSKYGLHFPLEEAVRDYSRRYGSDLLERLLSFCRSLLPLRRNQTAGKARPLSGDTSQPTPGKD